MIANNVKAKTRVCLIVDNPLRDLDGLTLLGWHLANKDVEVYLVSMSTKYEVFFIMPDLVLVNYIRKGNKKFVAVCQEMGIMIGVLDTEGGVLKDANFVFSSVFKHVNTVDLYCLWGIKQCEALQKLNILPEDTIKVTGCPRYDFCVFPWSNTLQDIPQSLANRKMVLVNTNFPIIQPRFQKAEKEAKQLVSDMGFEAEYVNELLLQTKTARTEVVKTVKQLALRFPQLMFVVRPHPFENKNYYENEFKGFSNVEIHQSGPVFHWIKHSIVVLHHNCATAIEAVLMGKEPVHLKWINTPLLDQPSSIKVSLHAHSPSELECMLKKILNGEQLEVTEELKITRQKIIRDWFFSNDGKNAERVANVILEAINKKSRKSISPLQLIKALFIKQLLQKDFKEFTKHFVILILGSGLYLRLKKIRYASGKEFGVEDVQAIITRIEKAGTTYNYKKMETTSGNSRLVKHSVRMAGESEHLIHSRKQN